MAFTNIAGNLISVKVISDKLTNIAVAEPNYNAERDANGFLPSTIHRVLVFKKDLAQAAQDFKIGSFVDVSAIVGASQKYTDNNGVVHYPETQLVLHSISKHVKKTNTQTAQAPAPAEEEAAVF